MKTFCDLSIEFNDADKVKTVLKSIEVDNFDFVKSWAKDNKLEAHIESNSVSSLLHTIDDYLSCVSVAEKIVDKD